jgi:nucleosome binding factor SPN SPT16 subunit
MNGMQVNPMELIQLIRSGSNPQQLMLGILEQGASSNPVYKNLMQLAKENKTAEIEQFARNLAQAQGLDFDKEFNAFKQKMGL